MKHDKIPKEATGGREEAGRLRPGATQHAERGARARPAGRKPEKGYLQQQTDRASLSRRVLL